MNLFLSICNMVRLICNTPIKRRGNQHLMFCNYSMQCWWSGSHYFGIPDLFKDPHQNEKQDPDTQYAQQKRRIRVKVKIHELWRVKMDPWRAMEALNWCMCGGVKWSQGGYSMYAMKWLHHLILGEGTGSGPGFGSASKYCKSATLIRW